MNAVAPMTAHAYPRELAVSAIGEFASSRAMTGEQVRDVWHEGMAAIAQRTRHSEWPSWLVASEVVGQGPVMAGVRPALASDSSQHPASPELAPD